MTQQGKNEWGEAKKKIEQMKKRPRSGKKFVLWSHIIHVKHMKHNDEWSKLMNKVDEVKQWISYCDEKMNKVTWKMNANGKWKRRKEETWNDEKTDEVLSKALS